MMRGVLSGGVDRMRGGLLVGVECVLGVGDGWGSVWA